MVRRALIALALLALVSGCTVRADPLVGPTQVGSGTPVRVADHCPMTAANTLTVLDPESAKLYPHIGALPADFVPVRVFTCETDDRAVSGDGNWRFAIERTAPGDVIARLAAAYRIPAAFKSDGRHCPGEFIYPDPQIAFVDAQGTAIWPAAPRDPVCGEVIAAVDLAEQTASWTTTDTRRVQQNITAEGCRNHMDDRIILDPKGPAVPGRFFLEAPTHLTVCVYRMDSASGGTYARVKVLLGDDFTAAIATLDAATPATPCTRTATWFAMLISDGTPQESYMELDGCQRVEQTGTSSAGEGQGLRQLDQAGVAALTAP